MIKALSALGYVGMIGGLARFAVFGELSLAPSPDRHFLAGAVAAAVLLGAGDVWPAQLPCGSRSDGRRFGDDWTVSVHPASDLRRDLLICFGRDDRELLLGDGAVCRVGLGQRPDTNLLRGDARDGTLSRVCSIRGQNLAHDPVYLLRFLLNRNAKRRRGLRMEQRGSHKPAEVKADICALTGYTLCHKVHSEEHIKINLPKHYL